MAGRGKLLQKPNPQEIEESVLNNECADISLADLRAEAKALNEEEGANIRTSLKKDDLCDEMRDFYQNGPLPPPARGKKTTPKAAARGKPAPRSKSAAPARGKEAKGRKAVEREEEEEEDLERLKVPELKQILSDLKKDLAREGKTMESYSGLRKDDLIDLILDVRAGKGLVEKPSAKREKAPAKEREKEKAPVRGREREREEEPAARKEEEKKRKVPTPEPAPAPAGRAIGAPRVSPKEPRVSPKERKEEKKERVPGAISFDYFQKYFPVSDKLVELLGTDDEFKRYLLDYFRKRPELLADLPEKLPEELSEFGKIARA
jgi:hypothetical protein